MQTVIYAADVPFNLGAFGYSVKQCEAIYAVAAERFNQSKDGYEYIAYTHCIEKKDANSGDSEFLYIGRILPQQEPTSFVVTFRTSEVSLEDLIERTIQGFYQTL